MAGLLGAELPDPDAGAASLQDPAAMLGLPTLPHLPRPVRILRSSRRGGVLLAAAPWAPSPGRASWMWESYLCLDPAEPPGGGMALSAPSPGPALGPSFAHVPLSDRRVLGALCSRVKPASSWCLMTPFGGHRGAPARGTGSRCDGRTQGLLPQLSGPFDSEKPP